MHTLWLNLHNCWALLNSNEQDKIKRDEVGVRAGGNDQEGAKKTAKRAVTRRTDDVYREKRLAVGVTPFGKQIDIHVVKGYHQTK